MKFGKHSLITGEGTKSDFFEMKNFTTDFEDQLTSEEHKNLEQ